MPSCLEICHGPSDSKAQKVDAVRRREPSLTAAGVLDIVPSDFPIRMFRIVENTGPSALFMVYAAAKIHRFMADDFAVARIRDTVKYLLLERRYRMANVPLINRIVPLPRGHLCYRDGSIYLNGQYLGRPLERASAGHPMPALLGRTLVIDGGFTFMPDVNSSLDR